MTTPATSGCAIQCSTRAASVVHKLKAMSLLSIWATCSVSTRATSPSAGTAWTSDETGTVAARYCAVLAELPDEPAMVPPVASTTIRGNDVDI
ncbi:hypothetical protein D3C71_1949580 [compost metagenome]